MFGSTGNATSGGGFSFGGAPTSTPATGGFSFGTAQTSAPAGGGFSFGSTPATTTSATGGGAGFSFGSAATSTPAAGGFSFGTPSSSGAGGGIGTGTTGGGGGFGGFSLGGGQTAATTAATTATTSAPSLGGGGFSFGAAAPKPTGDGTMFGGVASGGLSLGTPSAATAPTTAATSIPAPQGGLSSGSIFGIKQPTAATTTASGLGGFTGLPTATTGGSLLSGLLTSSTTTASAPSATTSATASAGFSFGAPTSSAAPTLAASAASSGPGLGSTIPGSSLGQTAPTTTTGTKLIFDGFGSLPSSTGATVTATTSATRPGAIGQQKQMTFRQLEDTINKWTTELEDQEKYFLDQATQVNSWDRIVMENGEKIIQLNKDVEKVKLDQQKLDHELDFVHSQQRELEGLLSPLEKALDSMPPISYQQHADVEREHTYMLAESLDAQLKRMGQDLKEIIERLNSTNSKPDPNDPVQQITKILNAHVVSLMWVDRNSSNLQKRVEEISKQMDIEKREQERNFRLAYS